VVGCAALLDDVEVVRYVLGQLGVGVPPALWWRALVLTVVLELINQELPNPLTLRLPRLLYLPLDVPSNLRLFRLLARLLHLQLPHLPTTNIFNDHLSPTAEELELSDTLLIDNVGLARAEVVDRKDAVEHWLGPLCTSVLTFHTRFVKA
jgi:hypothetical protein